MQKKRSLNSFSIESWNGNGWDAKIETAALQKHFQTDILGISEMHLKDSNAVLSGRLLKSGGDIIHDKPLKLDYYYHRMLKRL